MPLVPCRACKHQVDTSAVACPRCGATDPARKISRQQREFRAFIVQTVLWVALLGAGAWYGWNVGIPMLRQLFNKPAVVEQTQSEK